MAATFVAITQDEVEAFLTPKGFEAVSIPGTRELVYGRRVDENGQMMTVRVYTGIEPTGESRECGSDAIRAAIFWRRPDGEVRKIADAKRVHRVAGWKKNLDDRLASLRPGPSCPDCGAPMVVRKGKRGEFYGCSGYPACRTTAPVETATV